MNFSNDKIIFDDCKPNNEKIINTAILLLRGGQHLPVDLETKLLDRGVNVSALTSKYY